MVRNEKFREHCGVIAVTCHDYTYSISHLLYTGLMAIQHRGQTFSGISLTDCRGEIETIKGKGLVSKVLNPQKLKSYVGNVGIGHVCYAKHKQHFSSDIQPYHYHSKQLHFSIAFNGAIINYAEVKTKLSDMGRIFTGDSDVELIATVIEVLSKFNNNDMVKTLQSVMKLLKGAFSVVIVESSGNLFAFRDPVGYKPLCYGTHSIDTKEFHIIASESCVLDVIGGHFVRELPPGELIKISPLHDIETYKISQEKENGICQFEYTYFARPDSLINGVSVAQVRYTLGSNLAKNDKFRSENAIVVPVPDSGRSVAMGYSWESGISYQEGLMKNRYLWQPNADVKDKLNTVSTIVKDKDVILIDDSIISGNTLRKIISMLREVGVRSVHARVGCPPIIQNCPLNDRFTNNDLLIAYQTKLTNYNNFNEEMRKYIGADTLMFQTVDCLIDAIGLKRTHLCYNCLKEYCSVKKKDKSSNCNELELMI